MKSLALVDLIDEQNMPIDGLASVRSPDSAESPHERSILLQASSFKHIDYVFFRRFVDAEGLNKRSSQVAAYVIDNTNKKLSQEKLAELHHHLWLHGVAPLIYIAWPTRIDILSCARDPDFWDDGTLRYRPADSIEQVSEDALQNPTGKNAIKTAAKISDEFAAKRKRFSAYRLADGTFWDEPENQRLSKEKASAHRKLIDAIVEADKKLNGADFPIRRRLLVLMVLIKYLEDRGVVPSAVFGRFHQGAESFRDILRDGTVVEVQQLLRYFEEKFNGDVFSLEQGEWSLTQRDLTHFVNLVSADTLGGQRHFWELFSFEYIPVEVISRLYQQFVKGHGAVYTPPFLASLLLDQAMPYEHMTGEERVLDPACGSGVFLVGAFKRLVIHWRSRRQWKKPTARDLNKILAHSIHGVEMESGAVDLTAFSLALAVCDALEPPVIWESLRFEKLRGRNLREGDFFDPDTFSNRAEHDWPERFDIVIGNPPFESKLTPAAKALDSARPKDQPKLPDKQIAYLFLEWGLRSLAQGGSLCLIQPSGLLYNNNPQDFRNYLMSLCRLHTVLDFVSVSHLYRNANKQTVAWHAVNDDSDDNIINHITFRRSFATAEKIAFEIDHYDWHLVTPLEARDDRFVWRAGLLGGGRMSEISRRFREIPTLKELVERKGWEYGEGFIVGNRAVEAHFISEIPHLPTIALTNEGIDESRIEDSFDETHFNTPCNPTRFESPLILIKENSSLPVAYWDRGPLTYRDNIVGIHASVHESSDLKLIYDIILNKYKHYLFCCVVHAHKSLAGMATTINKQDIDRLPIPDDPSELDLSFWEEAIMDDVLDYMIDYVRLGQDSSLLNRSADPKDLKKYSDLFIRMLGSLYDNLNSHEPVFLNGLIAQPFYFGDRPDVNWLGSDSEEPLRKLIYDQSRESLRTIRVVRYYDENVILIVKPDRLRYWIRSTAIRDADETLIDLRDQGW